jgi:hypothetical protein
MKTSKATNKGTHKEAKHTIRFGCPELTLTAAEYACLCSYRYGNGSLADSYMCMYPI